MSNDPFEIGNFTIRFQALFQASSNVREVITNALKDSFPSYLEIEEIEIDRTIEIQNESQRGEHRFVCFSLSFKDILYETVKDVLNEFPSLLNEHVEFCWKFYDEVQLVDTQSLFSNLYKMEMNLREAISHICFHTYYPDFQNLTQDLQRRPKLPQGQAVVLWQRFENELFYFAFSDYKELLTLKSLNHSDIIDCIERSANFDEWKDKMISRGIKDEQYIDFIASIKVELEALEETRNQIMHHRFMSAEDKNRFHTNCASAQEKIEAFINSHYRL